jgi:hypothetical protein
MVFNATFNIFSDIVVVGFISVGKRSAWRKQPNLSHLTDKLICVQYDYDMLITLCIKEGSKVYEIPELML